jgi:hypothetical protein
MIVHAMQVDQSRGTATAMEALALDPYIRDKCCPSRFLGASGVGEAAQTKVAGAAL